MAKAKGQFYIIAAVFVLISLTMLFGFTLFVEAGSLTLPTHTVEFNNLQNAIEQRNIWLSTYWCDWSVADKTVATIASGYTNPVEFDADITSCGNAPVKVFKRSGIMCTEITPVDIDSVCNVTFSATGAGVYDVYWGYPVSFSPLPDVPGNIIYPPKYHAERPAEGICSHFSKLLPMKNIAFSCSATLLSNTYNYSVGFTATDFAYNGSIQ